MKQFHYICEKKLVSSCINYKRETILALLFWLITVLISSSKKMLETSHLNLASEISALEDIEIVLDKYVLTESDVIAHLDDPDWYTERVIQFSSGIAQLKDIEEFRPGPKANTLFGGLVLLAREFPLFPVTNVLENPLVKSLRPIVIQHCSISEYELEKYYAERILSGLVELNEFPYTSNYDQLMSFEHKCLLAYMGRSNFENVKKIIFIGSGPLPLSSIFLIRHVPKSVQVINYDLSSEAIELGTGIVNATNLSHRISFVKSSAEDITNLENADIVYVAALAGENSPQKQKIIKHLFKKMKIGSILVARSSIGLRQLLYCQLQSKIFHPFTNFRHFNPNDKRIINSIAIGMKERKSIKIY